MYVVESSATQRIKTMRKPRVVSLIKTMRGVSQAFSIPSACIT